MWTPDSRSLLFATVEGDKRDRCMISGQRDLRPLDPSFPLQAKLDPEGRRVVYHSGGNAFELWTLENFPSARGDDVDETVNAEERRGAVDHARSAAPDLLGTAASINREAPVLLVNEVIARQ